MLRSIHEIDVGRWDMIQPPGGFYASSPWLIHAERTAGTPPHYLFTQDWGAAMPAYVLEETSPYVFCRADFVLRQLFPEFRAATQLMPVLACGARNPGYTFIAVREGSRSGDAIRQIVGEAEEAAAAAGMKSVSYLHVSPDDGDLRDVLASRGYVGLPSKRAYALTVPASFDDYLAQFSSGRRSAIRRELKLLDKGGVEFSVEPLTEDLAERLAPLEASLYQRYGTPVGEAALREVLQSIARNIPVSAAALLAKRGGELAGFMVFFSYRQELYARQVGFDYNRHEGLPVYFGLVYYEVVKLAQARKMSTIYYGTGAEETKRSRGCREIATTAWIKSFDLQTQRDLLGLAAGLNR